MSLLLLESGDKALLESGGGLALEDHVVSVTLTVATETDSALALSARKTLTLTPASESDSAQAVDRDKYATLVSATEGDSAQALSTTQTIVKSLVAATETDSAQVLAPHKAPSLTSASESDAALELELLGLTAAVETDAAQALAFYKAIYFQLASQGATALDLVYASPKQTFISVAEEVDGAEELSSHGGPAQRLFVHKAPRLQVGSELDEAQALAITHLISRTLTPASETDAARSLSITGGARTYKVLVPAMEAD